MSETNKHPVVLRMAGMFPGDLGGYEGHRSRKGGDLGHVDRSRSAQNRRLHGPEDWAARARSEIEQMRLENFAQELAKLKKRRRQTELKKRIAEGPRDPWRGTRHGPLREVILTANKAFFNGHDSSSIDYLFGDSREARFEALAVGWLKAQFGEDLIHARADLDEETYHIHAVILPRAQTKDGRHMLQPSKHPMIKDYEAAQDSVGEWFAELGLRRGAKRAQQIREAITHNQTQAGQDAPVPVPQKRAHVSPADWRRAQEHRLAERERDATRREQDVDATLDLVGAVADGKIDIDATEEHRSRGPRETKARHLFDKALKRVKRRVWQQLTDRLQREFAEIRKADAVILRAAAHLPQGTRKAISDARSSLAAPLTRLKLRLSKLPGQSQKPPQDRGPER